MEILVKSCVGIEKKRSVLIELKERSGLSYEVFLVVVLFFLLLLQLIFGWLIRKVLFCKSLKENIKFDYNKFVFVVDFGFKGKEVNIVGQCFVFVLEKNKN